MKKTGHNKKKSVSLNKNRVRFIIAERLAENRFSDTNKKKNRVTLKGGPEEPSEPNLFYRNLVPLNKSSKQNVLREEY